MRAKMSLSLVTWLWCKLRGCDFFCTRELWRGKFWQWCPRVSVLMAGLSYGAGTVLSYSSPTMQNFLLFRDIHIIPLRRSPRYGGLAELITISMLCGTEARRRTGWGGVEHAAAVHLMARWRMHNKPYDGGGSNINISSTWSISALSKWFWEARGMF